jgi:hypothetical protein
MCQDKGYDFDEVMATVEAFGFTARIRTRRWVVERGHGWMNRFRRVLIRWAERQGAWAKK